MEFLNKLLSNASILEAIFSLILLVVTTYLLPTVRRFLKIKNDDKSRQYLDAAVRNALHAAFISYKEGAISPSTILTNQEVQDSVIAFAKNYVTEKVPDALAHFGIDDHGLVDLVTSRLPWELSLYSEAFNKSQRGY
jgi:hypothetical protein